MSRPLFNAHGVASHETNARTGQRVSILRRLDAGGYIVRFPDGEEMAVFPSEVGFVPSIIGTTDAEEDDSCP